MNKILMIKISWLLMFILGFAWNTAFCDDSRDARSGAYRPLVFVRNDGQWQDNVLFMSDLGKARAVYTSDGVSFTFVREIPQSESGSRPRTDMEDDNWDRTYETFAIPLRFTNRNTNSVITPESMTDYKCNYYLGDSSSGWRENVPSFERLNYENLYDKVNATFYRSGNQMEYDFIVMPGGDLRSISVELPSADSLNIGKDGSLLIYTRWGMLEEPAPSFYLEIGGQRSGVEGSYSKIGNKTFGFQCSNKFDPNATLVIDPILSFSTFLGGGSIDKAFDLAHNAEDFVYVIGATLSDDFPVEEAWYWTKQGDFDVFLTLMDLSDNTLLTSTFIGGDQDDIGRAIALRRVPGLLQKVMITGSTKSGNYPHLYGIDMDADEGEQNAFVTKLSPLLQLQSSTFLGGSGNSHDGKDEGYDIDVSSNGTVAVVGLAGSEDFGALLEDCYDCTKSGYEGFLVVFSNDSGEPILGGVEFGTFLGGTTGSEDEESAIGVKWDGDQNIYVCGYTSAPDFPLLNPMDNVNQGYDIFVSKLAVANNPLRWQPVFTTLVGGNGGDLAQAIAIDGEHNIFVVGQTTGDFPLVNAFDNSLGYPWNDGVVVKLAADGQSLLYSSLFSPFPVDPYKDLVEVCTDVAVDGCGNAYVVGYVQEPLANPWVFGYHNGFYAKVSKSGQKLVFLEDLDSPILVDAGEGVEVVDADNVYICGWTKDPAFVTTPGSFDTSHNGDADAIVRKYRQNYICGDADGNGFISISDAVFLVNYIFNGGPAPCPLQQGDADCNGAISTSDAVKIINYIQAGGSAPCCPQ